MPERTTVRLPEDLVRRAKRKAAAEGRSLTALIEDGLRKEPQKAGRTERIPPPVSAATGGLTPGIDLDDSAALQDMEDRGDARLV
jgi:plasmid stability protein